MDSFALSPINTQSVLTDNTDIEEPARKSWWKKINDSSADIVEILEDNKAVEGNCVVEELYDIEVLRQEKQNYTLDLPDSSDSESIKSIVLPQRKLFAQKENQPTTKFAQLVSSRKSLPKRNSNISNHDQTLKAGTKKLFQSTIRSKPVFPTGLLNVTSNTTTADNTKELLEEPNKAVKNIFNNQPKNKRKNMFMYMNFIVSDSEEEIPEVQPKLFAFPNKPGQQSLGIRASDVTSDMEMDSWTHLPSSTMVDHQSDEIVSETPIKKARLEPQEKEPNRSRKNIFAEVQEYIGDENGSSYEEIIDKNMLECQEIPSNTKFKNSITNLKKLSKDSDSMIKEKQSTIVNTNSNEEKEVDHDVRNQGNNNDNNVQDNAAIKKTNEEHERNNFTVRNNNENSKINGVPNNLNDSQTKDVKNAKDNKQNEVNQTQIIMGKETIEGNIKDGKHKINNEQEKHEIEQEIILNNIKDGKHKINNEQEKHEIEQEIILKNIEEVIGIKEKTVKSKEKIDDVQQMTEILKNNIDKIDKDDIVVDKQNIVNEASRSGDSGDKNNENVNKENENQNKVNKSPKNVDASSEIKNDICVNENQVDFVNEPDNNEENDQEITDNKDASNESQVNDVDEPYNNEKMDQEMLNVDDARNESHVDDNEPSRNEETDQEMSNNDDTLNKNKVDDFDELDNNEEISRDMDNSEKARNESQIDNVDEPDNDNDSDQEMANNNDVPNKSSVENVDEPDLDEQEIAGTEDVMNQSQVEDINKPDNDEESDQEMPGSGDVLNETQAENIEESDNNEETHEEVADSDDSDRALSNENAELDDDEVEVDKGIDEEDYLELKYDSDVEEDEEYEKSSKINEETEETSSTTHDITDSSKNNLIDKPPEAILRKQSRHESSFTNYDHNTSAGKTIMKNLNIRPSMSELRDSPGFSDGTKSSSAEGSGWDSHRTTRRTLRKTFGKDFTLRKSLRALVMEKSAKRQTEQAQHSETVKFPQANSTELPDFTNQDVDDAIESDHEISRRTQQATLETYLQKIKQENMEKRLKIEEKVRNSLKAPSRYAFNFLKVAPRHPKPSQSKPKKQIKTVVPVGDLPPELVLDMMYKPPKKFQPANASWITKRLYKFLETKLEPKYDYKARLRAEKLMETIYTYVKELRRVKVAPRDMTDALKHEMARLDVVTTHFEFYEFFNEYMPREVRIKVIPDIVNKIPLPREGVFAAILPENT